MYGIVVGGPGDFSDNPSSEVLGFKDLRIGDRGLSIFLQNIIYHTST